VKKIFAIATLAVLTFAGTANATTTINLGPFVTYASGGTLTPNVDLTTLSPAQLSLTGNAVVITPASSGSDYLAPNGGVVYGDSYLSVFGTPSSGGIYVNPTPGVATFNLAADQHTFGFIWSSVDPGNTLVLHATNGDFTFTGQDIADNLIGFGAYPMGEYSLVFNNIYGSILSATFSSTNNSFEAANFQSAVPLPAALPLFASAFVGFAALARRRRMI
jgi:hypothetical protein